MLERVLSWLVMSLAFGILAGLFVDALIWRHRIRKRRTPEHHAAILKRDAVRKATRKAGDGR